MHVHVQLLAKYVYVQTCLHKCVRICTCAYAAHVAWYEMLSVPVEQEKNHKDDYEGMWSKIDEKWPELQKYYNMCKGALTGLGKALADPKADKKQPAGAKAKAKAKGRAKKQENTEEGS